MQSVFRGSLRGWVEVGVQPKGRRRVWECHNSSVKLSLNAVFPGHDGTVYSMWLHQPIDHIRPSWCHENLCMKLARSWLPHGAAQNHTVRSNFSFSTSWLECVDTLLKLCLSGYFDPQILCAAKDASHLPRDGGLADVQNHILQILPYMDCSRCTVWARGSKFKVQRFSEVVFPSTTCNSTYFVSAAAVSCKSCDFEHQWACVFCSDLETILSLSLKP